MSKVIVQHPEHSSQVFSQRTMNAWLNIFRFLTKGNSFENSGINVVVIKAVSTNESL